MRIGFDARCLQTASSGGGVGRYARGLLERLPLEGDELLAYVSARRSPPPIPQTPRRRLVGLNRPGRGITLWDPFVWPARLRRDGVELFHSPFYGVPPRRPAGTAVVATVHDLIPILFDGVVTPRQRAVFRRHFTRALTAHRIIVPSRRTKEDLVGRIGADPERIDVIPLGLEERFFARGPGRDGGRAAERARGRLSPGGPYILHVGGFDPTKGLDTLLEAFGRLAGRHDTLKLVVCGAAGGVAGRRFASAVDGAGLAGRVVLPGRLDDERLAEAYAGAEMFVFPSLYEGFGLPPLEAMALGCPVVSSTGGSLDEVLAGRALTAAPGDAAGLEHAMERVLSEQGLRGRLVDGGREHARRFRWEEAVRRTVGVYRRARDEELRAGGAGGRT